MALRRSSFKGRSKFRTTRRFSRPLARVRRTWFPSFRVNICDRFPLPLNPCDSESDPENDLRIILVDQASLQGQFSDRARVRRIVGDIWWYAGFLSPPVDFPFRLASNVALEAWQSFIGLRKYETSAGFPLGIPYEPMMNDFDFTEAQWLKTWQMSNWPVQRMDQIGHNIEGVNFPVAEHTIGTNVLPCVSPPANSFVTGTGDICIASTVDVNCYNCENGIVFGENNGATTPRLHHFHIDFRRSIPLRENEELLLQLGYLFPLITTLTANEPVLNFWGGIKTLLEY